MNRFICPCCGYPGLHQEAYKALPENVLVRQLPPPYCQYFGDPSYEVCDCCGFEFGNDDEPGTAEPQSFDAYLKEWQSGGCVWFSEEARPPQWSLEKQLAGKRILHFGKVLAAPAVARAQMDNVVVYDAGGVKPVGPANVDQRPGDGIELGVEYRICA